MEITITNVLKFTLYFLKQQRLNFKEIFKIYKQTKIYQNFCFKKIFRFSYVRKQKYFLINNFNLNVHKITINS